MNWLQQQGFKLLEDWPPYSPDLNPIEHLWSALKRKLFELFPAIKKWNGLEEQLQNNIGNALKEAWRAIDEGIIYNCCSSMEKRIQAVIDAKG